MSLRLPKSTELDLFKKGMSLSTGLTDSTLRNIQACVELSTILRTSFGPNGRNKLVVNHLGKTFITSDAATIVREMEVVHPAAKVVLMASQQQESENGDSSNLVIILAGELLKMAEALLVLGLHQSEIVTGFEVAREFALAELEKMIVYELPKALTAESLTTAITPAIAAKQLDLAPIISPLVAEAAMVVMPKDIKQFNVDNVRVVKIMGGSTEQSRVVRGMVLGRQPEGTVKKAVKAKVAVYSCGLDIGQTETKGTVLLHNASEMMNFTHGEEKQLERYFKEIADAGVNVIIAGAGIGELALHYVNRFNILVIKILSKFELRRLCRVVGATPLARLGAPMKEELGFVDVVETIEIGGDRVCVFRQEANEVTRTATVVLRGATPGLLDDLERAVEDGVSVIKSLIRDQRLVPGAGATEIQLSKRIMLMGEKTPGLNQHAIKKFALALEVVPRTLAENTGADASETISKLSAKQGKDEIWWGVDIENEMNSCVDVRKDAIYDALLAKYWAIKYATNAAITVLRVDSVIMSKAAGIKAPEQKGNWDEDD